MHQRSIVHQGQLSIKDKCSVRFVGVGRLGGGSGFTPSGASQPPSVH